jgi:hypothetical protein
MRWFAGRETGVKAFLSKRFYRFEVPRSGVSPVFKTRMTTAA